MRIVIEASSDEILELLSHKEGLIHLFNDLKVEEATADDGETTYDEIEECNNNLISIRKYRLQKGWTQGQLAEKLYVVPTAVGMWETGKRKPDIITLKKLAQIFNCTTDDLLKDISTEN